MTIYGERIRLRALERSDIPDLVRWLNDPAVTGNLLLYLPISHSMEERWFESMLDKENDHVLGIETLEGRLIGVIGLHKIDWREREAELGIFIGQKEYGNRGYGTDAVRTMLRFAFRQMNLHRVTLCVFAHNRRAFRCYEKCGFQLEGRKREAHFYQGRYEDENIMGILAQEFLTQDGATHQAGEES